MFARLTPPRGARRASGAVALLALLAALAPAAASAGSSSGARPSVATRVAHQTRHPTAHHKRHRARRHAHLQPTGVPVPLGFVGMNADGALFQSGDGLSLAEQFAAMARDGVQTVRVPFSWAQAQPYANWSQVPADQTSQFVDAGGVPTDFAATDQIVNLAALYGLRLVPVVIYAPGWDATPNPSGISVPTQPAPYANFLTALIQRYGTTGSYWQSAAVHMPVRQWQIWNEPNLSYYWPQPSLSSYIALLRAAHAAVAAADPRAQTVLGALTNYSWKYLAQLYRAHARALFDVAAANSYTVTPAGVIEILRRVRRTMNAFGDRRKPLVATEVSWTSARGAHQGGAPWDTTEAGQAHRIARLMPLLAANRRALGLAGFDYYTWVGDETAAGSDWNWAGLLRVQNSQAIAKPALAVFTRQALALEACTARTRARARFCLAAARRAARDLPSRRRP